MLPKSVAVFLVGLLLYSNAIAQSPNWYSCFRTDEAPVIDGKPDDPAWETAQWSDAFVDIRDTSYPKPLYETRFKMLWDDNYLYVLAWLEEPHLRAKLTERDTVIFYDNDFEMFLDPDGDHHDYLEMELNVSNVLWDVVITEPYQNQYRALDAWDAREMLRAVGLYGTLNDPSDIDSGWVVEWAIPMLSVLELYTQDSIPDPGFTWKLNFSRVQWPLIIKNGNYQSVYSTWDSRKEENWVWSPQGEINMHLPERWGLVTLETHDHPLGSLPDTTVQLEHLRYDLMRLYQPALDYLKDNDASLADLTQLIQSMDFQWMDPDKLEYRPTRFGFEMTYPLDDKKFIRLTDDRRFRVIRLEDH